MSLHQSLNSGKQSWESVLPTKVKKKVKKEKNILMTSDYIIYMANDDGEIAEENKDQKIHLNQTCLYVGDGSLQAQDQGLDK